MMRTFLDKLRRLILGPNLVTFARMPRADVHQLLAIGSDEYLFFDQVQDRRTFAGARSVDATVPSGADPKELDDLRMEIALLKERISVLERVSYQRPAKDLLKTPREASL